MHLDDWAKQWGVSDSAMYDLRIRLGIDHAPLLAATGEMASEQRQQSLVRIEAAKKGIWLTRNNVGALLDNRGVPVRYGLANESKKQNEQIKSGDLIGMKSILITQQHVGQVIAQFVSRELKKEGWVFRGDEHETAQLNWCNFVISKGGDAAFCTGPGSFNF